MLAPALSYEYIRPHISVVPKFTLNHTQYLLDDPDSVFDDNESRSVATFSLDTKLFMERQFRCSDRIISRLSSRGFFTWQFPM